jgi:hypothetical protein
MSSREPRQRNWRRMMRTPDRIVGTGASFKRPSLSRRWGWPVILRRRGAALQARGGGGEHRAARVGRGAASTVLRRGGGGGVRAWRGAQYRYGLGGWVSDGRVGLGFGGAGGAPPPGAARLAGVPEWSEAERPQSGWRACGSATAATQHEAKRSAAAGGEGMAA